MAGKKLKSKQLNDTLEVIVKKFHERGIKNWFISYGTLLGIVREQSCIDGDDDIDICLDFKEKQAVQSALDELDGILEHIN